MTNNKLLLKSGIENIIFKNDESFKQSIIKVLSTKLNESIKETELLVSKALLYRESVTPENITLNEFVDFVTNFKPGNYKFQNGSNINITDSDILHIKNLFESLNVKNREHLVSELFTDGVTFKQHLTFSQKVRNLL
jgi:hypothetical protein